MHLESRKCLKIKYPLRGVRARWVQPQERDVPEPLVGGRPARTDAHNPDTEQHARGGQHLHQSHCKRTFLPRCFCPLVLENEVPLGLRKSNMSGIWDIICFHSAVFLAENSALLDKYLTITDCVTISLIRTYFIIQLKF